MFIVPVTNDVLNLDASKENNVNTSCSINHLETAETMKEFAFAEISNVKEAPVKDDDEVYVDEFAKFELEYKRRKQMHDEYIKKKEQQDLEERIKYQQQLEKAAKTDGWRYSDTSDSEKEEVNELKGEVAPFAYLISQFPYDFQKYVPLDPKESQRRRDKSTVWISDDHVPVGAGITDEYVYKRLKFLGENGEKDDSIFTVRITYYEILFFCNCMMVVLIPYVL
jgi:hypothetical protein